MQVDAGSLGNVYIKKNSSTTLVGPLTVTTSLSEAGSLTHSIVANDIITLEFDGTGTDATEIRGKIRILKT